MYDPSKDLMKLVALSSGIGVPAWNLVGPGVDAAAAAAGLRFPLFVKPSAYGDSMGIDEHSLVAEILRDAYDRYASNGHRRLS